MSEWRTGEGLDVPLARADSYLYGVKSAQRAEHGIEPGDGEYAAGALLPSM